jgi:hypothetical protein
MKNIFTGIANWYYNIFNCGKFGHSYTDITGTEKKTLHYMWE